MASVMGGKYKAIWQIEYTALIIILYILVSGTELHFPTVVDSYWVHIW